MTEHSPPSSIPDPDSVSPGFLQGLLTEAGFEVVVAGFEVEPVGTGQIGQCIRYRLEFAGEPGGAPRTLIGKFASDDPTSRQTGVLLRNFLKEVRFYQQLQQRVSIRTPRCYFAEIVGEGPCFALFLEDMAPAEQGNQLAGCSPQVAEVAVLELVGLHAPTWNDSSLQGIAWLGTGQPDPDRPNSHQLYQQQMPAFFDRLGDRLKADERRIIEQVAVSSGPPFVYPPQPTALVHIDFRLDNLLIDQTGPQPRVTTVDWQSIAVGSPLSDVAYFLGAGLLSEQRRLHEERIVEGYYRGLTAAGIEHYDWQDCFADYRRGVFAGFAVTVIATPMVVETERGNEMFATMARRHARHALDLGSAEFL